MTDELRAERADENLEQQDAEDVAADAQVGTGTAPGQPPAMGTGERSQRRSSPPTGRLDPERASWGASDDVPGAAAEGMPQSNVGGAQGDQPADPVADFPADDAAERAGFREPGER